MRGCPTCRAEVNDSVYEYCGTELPLNEKLELAIKNAELMLKESDSLLNKSYKLHKYELDIINKLSSSKFLLESNYPD